MASIDDIVQVAEALEKSPIAVLQDRCVAVRNRNATCRKCVEACPFDVIEISANEIHFNASACVGCGACAVACPTEALAPVNPTDSVLAGSVAQAAAENGGVAVFACARIASKRLADPSLYAEVACLSRVEESLLVSLAAHGAREILLVDGDCASCKHRACIASVDYVADQARAIVAAQGGVIEVSRQSSFPESMLVESSEGLFGSTRRGFFSEAASAAKETAMAAAKTTMAQELGFKDEVIAIGERLRVDETGAMPRLSMARHDALINAMYEIGESVVDEVETRRFANVVIDAAKCNACGMCAVFCPTGSLRRDDADSPSAALKSIEFHASECVQCGLCRDVCWKGALELSSMVSTAQLFDFEPVVFDLSGAGQQKKGLFGH